MSGAATTARRRPTTHHAGWWIWIVVAILLAAPVRSWSPDTSRPLGAPASDRAHATDAPAWTTADLASNRPDTNDRRDAPGGTVPGVVVWTLGALVMGAVAVARIIASGKPRIAFRRRGPPLLLPVR